MCGHFLVCNCGIEAVRSQARAVPQDGRLAKAKSLVKSGRMKTNFYRLTTAAALAAISQQSMATPPPPPNPSLEYILASEAGYRYAWQIAEGLTTEVGARQGGTEAEARARVWSVARLKEMGFSNVRSEEFDMPTWVRGDERAEVVVPFPQKLAITALGNSASTGEAGLTAEIVYFKTLDDLRAVPDGSLIGKIAFIDHAMRRTQDGSSYGQFGQARFVGPNIASQKGASAVVIRSIGTDSHRNPHTGNTNFNKGVKPIPAGALSNPDADNLVRMVNNGPNLPIKLKLTLTPKNIGMQKSGNVIAELPGSDPSLPIIVVACHLDSWDLGTGAIDDASGCAIITGAVKHLHANGVGRKRTIRLLWAGAEEVGVWGGESYSKTHGKVPHGLAMESDFGAGRIWKADFRLPDSAKPLRTEIEKNLRLLGIAPGGDIAGGGADVGPIIAAQKPSVIDLQQDGTHYFDLHHTPDDTLDKIDKDDLKQNVLAWALVLKSVANYEGNLAITPKLEGATP